ncbi:hypothetical protein HZY97_16250 [Sphingomonas sp. R-74633]|uniref:hypothetical protein n=1 Tax=Sphingomonas sp. R-74633 TaxID=2751188 RepID=UPI0015D27855|nr:hypothetical protein [Sphingomonas sp. R-74633]NYT42325.1 hypothetical protein [Sphingomonas sp. R-74633]
MSVAFFPFSARDAMRIRLQESQRVEMGIDSTAGLTMAQALDLEQGAAWTAREVRQGAVGRILCCAGFREIFTGRQGLAWAMLADGLSATQLLSVTRFARARIAASPLRRIECLTADRAPERQWAELVGMRFNTLLHAYGAASETVCLYERVKG